MILFVGTMLLTLTSLGFLLDGKKVGVLTEIVRCLGGVLVLSKLSYSGEYEQSKSILFGFFLVSLISFVLFAIKNLFTQVMGTQKLKKK